MSDDRLRDAYRARVAREDGGDAGSCPDPEGLLAVLERRGDEAHRLQVLDHAMACRACREDLDLLRAVAQRPPRSFMPSRPALALAASLVIALGGVGLWRLTVASPDGAQYRGEAPGVELVEPRGSVVVANAGDVVLRWRAVAGAVRYQVEITDPDGSALRSASVADTVLSVPREDLKDGADLLWYVQAVREDGSTVTSVAAPFRIVPD